MTMPLDVQNTINPFGEGNENEIEIELNFPGHTPSFISFWHRQTLSGTS